MVWDYTGKKIITSHKNVTELLFLYLYDKNILNENERNKLINEYASSRQIETSVAKEKLEDF